MEILYQRKRFTRLSYEFPNGIKSQTYLSLEDLPVDEMFLILIS
jgi:hypothetical protein